MFQSRRRWHWISSWLVAVAIGLVASSGALAAQPAFEPNDSLPTAFGPLGLNQTYTAATETSNDVDYFYFYVNSPSSSQVNVTLRDFGGGPHAETFTYLDLDDVHGYELEEISAFKNNFRSMAVTLAAGKYYLEVGSGSSNYGGTYTITTGGTDGAYGEFAPIAAQCAAATAVVTAAQEALGKAQLKARKASAKVTRNRHKRWSVRKAAAKGLRKAKKQVTIAEDGVDAAMVGQKPWCLIPQ